LDRNMALYAAKGYNIPGDNQYGDNSFEKAKGLSAFYGSEDAKLSEAGHQKGEDSFEFRSFTTNQSSNRNSTVSTELGVRTRRKPSGIFDVLLGVSEGREAPVEASVNEVENIHDYWHNYDIHKSLKPKLLPDEDYNRAQTLLYAFRIHYAKAKKNEFKIAKEHEIHKHYAWKIQCAARQKIARGVRRAKELEKEREADEFKRYNAFKRKLLEGIDFKLFDRKTKTMKDVTAIVDVNKPKLITLRGPQLASKVKFELTFLYKVHVGWTSASIKDMPRELRSPKEISLSLEGKTTIDLACKGIIDDAKYDREEFVMCFNRLMKEMNSSASIYRDAAGNRVRVLASVFTPLNNVEVTSSKDNPVTLAGKNMAALYKIQHRFSKHKAKIAKGVKARTVSKKNPKKNEQQQLQLDLGDGVEVESRPSTMSDLSMYTDEADYAQDPSKWSKNNKKGASLTQRLADREAQSELNKEEEALLAKQAILARRGGAGGGGRGSMESESESESDSEESDSEEYSSEESSDDDEFDDQASYTEYTETREEDENDLLEDSDEDDE